MPQLQRFKVEKQRRVARDLQARGVGRQQDRRATQDGHGGGVQSKEATTEFSREGSSTAHNEQRQRGAGGAFIRRMHWCAHAHGSP